MVNKEKDATSACFVEMWRWFNHKLGDYSANVKDMKNPNDWINMLKNSHVYAQEVDENDNPTGNWFSIVGFVDHGPNVTLQIRKPDGKIEV